MPSHVVAILGTGPTLTHNVRVTGWDERAAVVRELRGWAEAFGSTDEPETPHAGLTLLAARMDALLASPPSLDAVRRDRKLVAQVVRAARHGLAVGGDMVDDIELSDADLDAFLANTLAESRAPREEPGRRDGEPCACEGEFHDINCPRTR